MSWEKKLQFIHHSWFQWFFGLVLLGFLGVVCYLNYLLFHGIAEIFSIVIAFSIFAFAWNTRRIVANDYLIFVGIAYLFIGFVDFVHTMAYKGMGVFPWSTSDLSTQLWITARTMESVSLLIAPLFLRRKIAYRYIFLIYIVITSLFLALIFQWKMFPHCFIEGKGLTQFKKASEYAICLILLASLYHIVNKKKSLDRKVLIYMESSIIMTIASEISFTFYIDVYDLSNVIGHFFKIISFYLIYKAIIQTGLKDPYSLLFKNLKESEENLRKAKEELERLNEYKDHLLGITVHDLRNPIAIFKGFLEYLEVPKEQVPIKEKMNKNCERMLKMISNLLDINAIKRGKLRLEKKETDIAAFLKEIYESNASLAKSRHMELVLETEPNLPTVKIDPDRINQVIANLLSNAMKFSRPNTKITLKAKKTEGNICISVEDQGLGIPKEQISKIFKEFGTTGVATQTAEKSMGLGLVIVEQLVLGHGGEIKVESEPGKGSVFSFTLPI